MKAEKGTALINVQLALNWLLARAEEHITDETPPFTGRHAITEEGLKSVIGLLEEATEQLRPHADEEPIRTAYRAVFWAKGELEDALEMVGGPLAQPTFNVGYATGMLSIAHDVLKREGFETLEQRLEEWSNKVEEGA